MFAKTYVFHEKKSAKNQNSEFQKSEPKRKSEKIKEIENSLSVGNNWTLERTFHVKKATSRDTFFNLGNKLEEAGGVVGRETEVGHE